MSSKTVIGALATLALSGVLVVGMAPLASAAGPADAFVPGAQRISGVDRIATAVNASRATFPDASKGTGVVVLASAATYADAIGGGTLAAVSSAPLLLTDPGSLRSDVADEVERIAGGDNAGMVFVLGGDKAVSPAVVAAIEARDIYVERIFGADRYATAVKIAEAVNVYSGGDDGDREILVVTGTNFPDGLAVAPFAAYNGSVVVLSDGANKAQATTDYLARLTPDGARILAVGGPANKAYPNPMYSNPVVGRDRYETAAGLTYRFGPNTDAVGLSTGENWPDALAAGAVLGQAGGGPLLLTPSDQLNQDAANAMGNLDPVPGVGLVFGGTKAVSASVYDQFASRF